jgi:mono/diheme cytochrome c family protein
MACLLLAAGCQQEMAEQPKYLPLQQSELFADGRSARPLEPGTVARGHPGIDSLFLDGKVAEGEEGVDPSLVQVAAPRPRLAKAAYFKVFPSEVTLEVLQRGQERFTIYCVVCHDAQGAGKGIVVDRGFTAPLTYHDDRLRDAPVGYLFDVATHGFGSMPDYSAQIPPQDRWAIVAYIRALQLSRYAPLRKFSQSEREAIRQEIEKHDGDAR